MMSVRTKQKLLITLLILGTLLFTGCRANSTINVPSDFHFSMDVNSAGDFAGCVNINISLDAEGRGLYEVYDTGCTIEFDSNHMVTYQQSQVIKSGKLRLNNAELEGLWKVINESNFFELTGDYRMSLGFSYAFIVVEADGERHIVDNIGMEIPEVRAIVKAADAIMPKGINLDYREGFSP